MGRALVIGCGGTLGFAWTAAVLAELERQGWDPRTADVLIGTSAGAELVALLGSGVPAAAIADGSDARVATHLSSARAPGALPGPPRPGLPGLGLTRAALAGRVDVLAGLAGLLPRGGGDAQWLVDLGDTLADPATGWTSHPQTWLVAADARTGDRIPLGRADAPKAALGQAIAASWAIPAGSRRSGSAGVRSSTAAPSPPPRPTCCSPRCRTGPSTRWSWSRRCPAPAALPPTGCPVSSDCCARR
jgi:NTE family protein